MSRSVLAPLCSLTLACGLLLLAVPDAQAQSQRGRRTPTYGQSAPGQSAGRAPARAGQTGQTGPAGTKLPSYAEPAPPPAYGSSPGGAAPSGPQAQANSGPSMPSGPSQVPLGGAEYLAAAGAAYALNRLRKQNGADADEEDSEEM